MSARWALAFLAVIVAADSYHGWTSAKAGQPLTCTPTTIAAYAYGLAGGGQ